MSGAVGSGGVSLSVPSGWDGRARGESPRSAASSGAREAPGERIGVVLHAGSFALPNEVGEYGSGAVERMTSADVLLCVVEHDPEDVGRKLFRRRGVPTMRASDFDPNALQRVVPGMSGAQWFFQVADRAFCLYGVLGSHRSREELAPRLGAVVRTLDVR